MSAPGKTITPSELIQVILKQMGYGGHNPTYQNIFTKVFSTVIFSAFSTFWILLNVYIATTKYVNLGVMIMDIVIWAAIWQIFTKTVNAHWKRQHILKLLDIIYNKFWTKEMLTETELIKSQEIYKYCTFITKGYTVSIYLTMCGHTVTAILRGNHNLIINCWMPESVKQTLFTTPNYEILLVVQFIVMGSCSFFGLLQMDNLFVTTVAVILAQFKILKSKFLALGKPANIINDSKMIIKCIDYHNLLFEALETVENIFSGLILHVYASNIILGVITLLGLLVEQNVTQMIEFNFILVSVYGQLYIYCFLGQLVQDETLSVANAAYNCNWEDIETRNIKMSLLMTIQRSQQPTRLTMGGFFVLCLQNFTRISRLMLSILTLMLNMRDNS